MSHRRSYGSHAVTRADEHQIVPRATVAHDDRGQAAHTAAARWFYCDVLHGRQVWPSDGTTGRALWFQIGSALVAVHRDHEGIAIPVRLVVDDPAAMAERCWDAGFTVQVHEAAPEPVSFVVTDPFARRLVLVPNGAATVAGATTDSTLHEVST
ncbi:MAG TPA: hypothetical protein VKA54_01795 [Gemmatimonadaceae bacterium]|nr:hypothetical protein [Gemmatimonadaceae bacterium]